MSQWNAPTSLFLEETEAATWFLGGPKSTLKLIHKEDLDIEDKEMNSTLQDLFIQSQGKPVSVGDRVVTQLCRIPVRRGVVEFRFISPPDSDQGLCVKAKGGAIVLSDGTSTETLHIWHEPGLPETVVHRVACPYGELLVWNIYRVHHTTGEITEDYWTGNAGMVALHEGSGHRRYACSDWRTPFDPSVLIFQVDWSDQAGHTSNHVSHPQ